VASSGKQRPKLDPSATFGQLLRKHRLGRKMSQEALAARSGYERAFISLIELSKTNPSLRSIFDIVHLGVHVVSTEAGEKVEWGERSESCETPDSM
jgi:transcriptional regulator with XRE-family HTH domain